MKSSALAHLRTLDHSGTLSGEAADALQALRALVGALSETARAIESRTGISNAQLFLLQRIAEEPNLSVNALAERAMTHQSTVSIVLSRLERRGLVERVRSPADGRSVVLRLTPRGRRLVRRAPTPATSQVVAALGRITDAELRALSRGVSALGRELGLTNQRPGFLFELDGRPPRTTTRKRRRSAARARAHS